MYGRGGKDLLSQSAFPDWVRLDVLLLRTRIVTLLDSDEKHYRLHVDTWALRVTPLPTATQNLGVLWCMSK